MVDREVSNAGIRAMQDTPRHLFVPSRHRRLAYVDSALPIGYGQTISPPSVVAYMTEQLDLEVTDTVLEIGTGTESDSRKPRWQTLLIEKTDYWKSNLKTTP